LDGSWAEKSARFREARSLAWLLATQSTTVLPKCRPATQIQHDGCGGGPAGRRGGYFPSVMLFAPRGATDPTRQTAG